MPATQPDLRVTFLTHYFPPEVGPAQVRLFELAKLLTAAGKKSVTVVTGFPNYPAGVVFPGYRRRLFMEDRVDGIRVLRTWVFASARHGFLSRLLNYFSFPVFSLLAVRKLGRTDIIYVQSPPLFTGLAALWFSRLKRAPFVFNVSDIWPQSAVELGILRNRFAIGLAEMFERHIYRRAARITVPTPGILERLAARGVPRDKLVLLTNGVDTAAYQIDTPDRELASRFGLDGHKVFMYAGLHGLAQGLEVILDAAKLTRNPEILYVLVGDGAEKTALVAKAQREEISNIRFLPIQPTSTLPALLNLAYATIIPLKRLELFKAALPSKIFDSMAAGRPIVAPLWGEAADLVSAADC
ncbi:MAG TPA: glycosyltransferase family 4 protein, partial [Candidatus Acidoferrum sp.]|nr:glycosyltransferase family 4 protein [Candidatus Acidoferrum sp.]